MNVLLTGANGYIGMRLLPALLKEGHRVYCVVRDKKRIPPDVVSRNQVSVCEADLLISDEVMKLPKDIDVAYYLVHSMSDRTGNFSEMEGKAARNFVDYIDRTRCKRMIYLSGISNEDELSEHLESRFRVEQILFESRIPLTVLRAGIIVGSGSASFEIIRDLVEKLPVMVAPKWLNTKCQPIAIRNVIQYLTGVLNRPETENRVYDIGGPEVLTYREMLLDYAKVRQLKRYIITLPVLSPRLSSLWLYFVTATSYHLARNLVDSMKVDVVARGPDLSELIEIEPISYERAVELAFQKIEQNLVLSSWKDAVVSSGSEVSHTADFVKVPVHGCYVDTKERVLNRDPEEILDNIWRIGGENGWYYGTYLWKLRGYLDKLVGGIGLRRGRRSTTQLFPGDALDFWRVIVASRENRRLLLFAEMKLPGEAWLEFSIVDRDLAQVLRQTATFRPRGLLGRLYWYAVWPFHVFVFDGMIDRIATHRLTN
jgi:uncharacterized protein YbjT (DUF2867 family)